MLKVNPKERPDCAEILKLNIVKNKAQEYGIDIDVPIKGELENKYEPTANQAL